MKNPDPRKTAPRSSGSRQLESHQRMSGITLLEILLALAVIGILATFIVPRMLCALERSHLTKTIKEIEYARDVVETYMVDSAWPPETLEQAYEQVTAGSRLPSGVFYCSGWYSDPNKGHGNDCDFYDEQNPGGSNPGEKQGTAGVKYIMRTDTDLAPRCSKVDFVWLRCCDAAPEVVKTGDWNGPLPGRDNGSDGNGQGPK